jgi:hypothetical protein
VAERTEQKSPWRSDKTSIDQGLGADDGNRIRIISVEARRADFVSGVVTCEDVL